MHIVWCLKYQRYVVKTRVIDKHLKKSEPNHAAAAHFMTVDPRAKPFLTVVYMHSAEIIAPYDCVKLFPHCLITLRSGKIISCRKSMARIDTYAYTTLVFDTIDNTRYLLKAVAEIATLAGRILYHCLYARCLAQSNVERFRDTVETLVNPNLVEMATRMKVKHCQPQLLTPLQFVNKCIARHREFIDIRTTQINKKAIVGKNMFGSVSKLLAPHPELLGLSGGYRRRLPSRRISGKKGKRLGTYGMGIDRRTTYTLVDRYMCSDIFHTIYSA